MHDAHRAVEAVARASYGRLVAYLSAHTHDVAGAEDALGDALVDALSAWARDGVPNNPAAWLTQTAKNLALDLIRREKTFHDKEPEIRAFFERFGDRIPEPLVRSLDTLAQQLATTTV